MNITLNGKPAVAEEGETLAGLIEKLNVKGMVAALLNEEVVRREDLGGKKLKDGDVVELLRMMGGG